MDAAYAARTIRIRGDKGGKQHGRHDDASPRASATSSSTSLDVGRAARAAAVWEATVEARRPAP